MVLNLVNAILNLSDVKASFGHENNMVDIRSFIDTL
jgi:hypothetical protein